MATAPLTCRSLLAPAQRSHPRLPASVRLDLSHHRQPSAEPKRRRHPVPSHPAFSAAARSRAKKIPIPDTGEPAAGVRVTDPWPRLQPRWRAIRVPVQLHRGPTRAPRRPPRGPLPAVRARGHAAPVDGEEAAAQEPQGAPGVRLVRAAAGGQEGVEARPIAGAVPRRDGAEVPGVLQGGGARRAPHQGRGRRTSQREPQESRPNGSSMLVGSLPCSGFDRAVALVSELLVGTAS